MTGRKGTSITLVNGTRLRVTRLDSCGRVQYGDNMVGVSESFVSVAAKVATTSTSAVTVTNAAGKTLVNVPEVTSFSSFGLELQFASVDPELFSLITGQRVLYDANGQPNGVSVDSSVSLTGQGIALEVWAGSPSGDACDDDAAEGSFGYVLFPFLQGGVLGDHTIAAGAISFTLTGVTSKDGNAWGHGPHKVEIGSNGQPGPLVDLVKPTEHEVFKVVGVTPPDETLGLRPLLDPSATAITAIVGSAGTGAHGENLAFTGATAGSKVEVDFGDGTWDYVTGTSTTHTYPAGGVYTVRATTNGTWIQQNITVA
jgi:hypothetical protein